MRHVSFLLAGLALLVLQSNVFRVLDGLRPGVAVALWVLALVADGLRTLLGRGATPGQPRPIALLRADLLLPATVVAGYVLLVSVGHAHLGRPIPALVLPLILFMGVHEYSLARGAAVAFVFGYATDVLGIAPVGLYTFTYVTTFVLARGAGVRLAAQTTMDAGAARGGVRGAPEHDDPRAHGHLRARRMGAAVALSAGAASRDRHGRHRARGVPARPGHPRHDRGVAAGRNGERHSVSDLLVARSDVGEFRTRYKWLALFTTLMMLTVMGRLFQLQLVEGDEFAAIAHENIIRRVILPTTRGVIRDETGKVLASTRPAFNVEVVPGRVMPSARPVRYRNGQVLPHDPDSFPKLADILRLNPEERRALDARIHAACGSDDDKSPCWKTRILVREDVPRDIVAELKQHTDELAGVDVDAVPVRYYPFKELGAHMLGYVAEIDSEALSEVRPAGLRRPLPRRAAAAESPGLRGGRPHGCDGHRARVGELSARPARLGEARGRRARPLPHRARRRAARGRSGAPRSHPGA